MPLTQHRIDKRAVLRQQGVLNPHPEAVHDPLFHQHEFFDPCDLVQVKYEMLRRVQVEKQPMGPAAAAFGFSRPSFYHAQAAFAGGGLFGLVPQKRGPRHAHKLTPALREFLEKAPPAQRIDELARQVEEHFGVRIHPRSLARGRRACQKKRYSAIARQHIGPPR